MRLTSSHVPMRLGTTSVRLTLSGRCPRRRLSARQTCRT
jgi:hypothetical protein